MAAIGKNGELGKDNNLIWKIKEDMKFFKSTTMNHYILMGRKTLESLPGLLPSRKHLIISSTLENIDGIKIYKSIEDFLNDKTLNDEKIYIIGGASIYKEMINYSDELLITHINEETKADVYFPNINKEEWKDELLGSYNEKNFTYKRVKYMRKGNH